MVVALDGFWELSLLVEVISLVLLALGFLLVLDNLLGFIGQGCKLGLFDSLFFFLLPLLGESGLLLHALFALL